jgi:gamma-tubulin complex component 3
MTRPHEQEEELPRNIRRRLTLESTSNTETIPIAVQLAHARQQHTVPETDLIRDLIYLFQGIDGQYIRYDTATHDPLFAPGIHVSKPMTELVFKLTETGWFYTKVRDFVQFNNHGGLTGQSLCAAFQHELTEYYKFIAMLEAQLEKQIADQVTDQTLTLKRLAVWTLDTNQKLKLMHVLIEACSSK